MSARATQAAVAAAVLLGACAHSSEALQIGPNTFQTQATAAPARGGASAAQAMALETANTRCKALGRQIQVVSQEPRMQWPNSTHTVVFKCE